MARRSIFLLLLAVGLFGCDHATKIAAEGSLASGRVVPVVDGVLELRYQPTEITAFGLLHRFGVDAPPALLVALAVAALAAIGGTWLARRGRASLLEHVGFALVAAGALGNVLDRMLRGYVVDFIHLTRWPVFNVADVAVVVGAVLVGMRALFTDAKTAPPRDA